MKKLKEVAQLYLELGLRVRPIARACNISASTGSVYVERLKRAGVTYQEVWGNLRGRWFKVNFGTLGDVGSK